MRYKALIVDCDGTIVGHMSHLPTETVRDAIKKAEKKLFVGLATGRPLVELRRVLEYLDLTSPCVINAGSQIIDPKTYEILWRKTIDEADVQSLFEIIDELNLSSHILINDGIENTQERSHLHKTGVYKILIRMISAENAEQLTNLLSAIPSIVAHMSPSRDASKYYVDITHTEATKQHGIFEVAKLLHIQPHEMIGIGDGGNDFPLLTACGFKVAMGNASDDLKAIADYVAPSVEDDGVVDVIEKFILSQ